LKDLIKEVAISDKSDDVEIKKGWKI